MLTLIPFWTKDEKSADEIKRMTLNARADTIFEKPSFREPIMKKRCIVPSTGYFEWRHEGGRKIPYYIYLKDEPIFSMAGVYNTGSIKSKYPIKYPLLFFLFYSFFTCKRLCKDREKKKEKQRVLYRGLTLFVHRVMI